MLKPEYLTLLNLIIKRDSENIEKFLESYEIDFEDFNKFVWDGHFAGNLYSVLTNSGLAPLFPETLIEAFKPSYLMQWTKNEKLVKEIEFLSGLFHKAGKEVIFLKGPFLAERFYGNIDSRAISDIDILIKREEIDEAEDLLKRSGFERTSLILLHKSLSMFFAHHFEYARGEIDLELHWALATHYSFSLDYKRIWQEKNSFEYRKKNYWVLCDEYELVFQILSIFKDIELGTIKLKSFVDAYMILKAGNNHLRWEEFLDYRRKEGLYSISVNTLDLVLSLLDCREEFSELSSCVERDKMLLKRKTLPEKMSLLEESRYIPRRKLWALGLYDTPAFNAFCWWGVSLPFRMAVYQKRSPQQ